MKKNVVLLLFLGGTLILSSFLNPRTQKNISRKTLKDTVFNIGDIIALPKILFDFDKCTLLEYDQVNSKDSLKQVAAFLAKYPKLVVEIGNHADKNCPECSVKLTECRARTCRDSLVKFGIDPDRILHKGYGDTQKLISEKEIQKMKTKDEQEEAHQKNRRTELKVLSI